MKTQFDARKLMNAVRGIQMRLSTFDYETACKDIERYVSLIFPTPGANFSLCTHSETTRGFLESETMNN